MGGRVRGRRRRQGGRQQGSGRGLRRCWQQDRGEQEHDDDRQGQEEDHQGPGEEAQGREKEEDLERRGDVGDRGQTQRAEGKLEGMSSMAKRGYSRHAFEGKGSGGLAWSSMLHFTCRLGQLPIVWSAVGDVFLYSITTLM